MRMMKVDVLGLGMLGCLRRCFELIQSRYHRTLDMTAIPPEDPETYQMIARADTLGTFQIESRAQMAMLPRTKPATFYDLVVQVAIVRPGPITGDMVHPYLRRRAGEEAPDCPSPALQRILGKTLGIPLFQEQAMQVAVHCAGFTGGEADQLRRSMGTFRSTGEVHHMKERLLGGMIGNGYAPAFAAQIWTQLEGFGAYGFPESHAASFALIAYVSAWLKCHYPDVFCAALLNSQPMGFYAPAQIVRDAREHGVEVRPVCINASRWDCTLEASRNGARQAVRLGFRLVSGLSCDAMARLILARGAGYDSLDDVWRRSDVSLALLEKLAEADGFQALGLDRRQALWTLKGFGAAPLPLFEAADRGRNAPTPELWEPDPNLPQIASGSAVVEDYHATGLSLRAHPVSFLRDALARQEITPIADLAGARDGAFVRVAGLVLMRQRPSTAKGVMFMTLEDETGTANLIFWKDRIAAQRAIVVGSGFIAAHGRLQREGDVIHLVVRFVEDLQPMLSRLGEASGRDLETRSRDFR
jgi:error-prone DNA polymerase